MKAPDRQLLPHNVEEESRQTRSGS